MSSLVKPDGLIIPVYINEKIVLDMLAILDDGFSMVSQLNYQEYHEAGTNKGVDTDLTTSASLLSKLLKINISGSFINEKSNGEVKNCKQEKIHTNVSLLSKFINYLSDNNILKKDIDFSTVEVGDFIEVKGYLQKNPLIEYMDTFFELFRLAKVFEGNDKTNNLNKNKNKSPKQNENDLGRQIKAFTDELKHTGTIDFILEHELGTTVLSAQEKYLENDNISELIGGSFKVLGKVISVYNNENDSINLLRKSTLSVLSNDLLDQLFTSLNSNEMKQFNLPKLKIEIQAPAIIVIPIAIYA